MTDYLKLACLHLGVEEGSVLASSLNAELEQYIIVVDNGIKGCPKYRIPLSKLDALDEPAEVVELELPIDDDLLPVPAAIDLGGDYELSYRDLQALAKDAGIPANQSAEDLRDQLEELTNGL